MRLVIIVGKAIIKRTFPTELIQSFDSKNKFGEVWAQNLASELNSSKPNELMIHFTAGDVKDAFLKAQGEEDG